MEPVFNFAENSAHHNFHMYRHINDAGYRHSAQKRVSHDLKISDLVERLPGEILVSNSSNSISELLWSHPAHDGLVITNIYEESIWIFAYSHSPQEAERLLNAFKEAIPPVAEPDDTEITVNFWLQGLDGKAANRTNKLKAPSWEAIARNYAPTTQAALNSLMSMAEPTEGGKLILLHGKPGGGKSYAIRALSKAWAPWCDTHYLMDPDRFFSQAQYMFEILLSHPSSSKYKLIVAEDSDEFIRADSKSRTGQGLARLLNLADGIMGQGMKIIILLTTNERLEALHPAVIRPGRCLANIEFRTFTRLQAAEWMGKDPDALLNHEYSLAEMYDNLQIVGEKEVVSTGGMYL